MPGLQDGHPDLNKLKPGTENTPANEYVMIPKGVPFFDKHFKTVTGILSFEERPW